MLSWTIQKWLYLSSLCIPTWKAQRIAPQMSATFVCQAVFVDGVVIHSWAVLNFGAVNDATAGRLAASLARRCNELGMVSRLPVSAFALGRC